MAVEISTTQLWVVFLAIAVGTYMFRVSFIALMAYIDEVPAPLTRAFRLIPAAVLAALVAPALIAPDGTVAVSLGNERLLAGMVGIGVATVTENMLATIVIGMGALYLFEYFPL